MSPVACELRVLSPKEREAHLALTSTLFAEATSDESTDRVIVRLGERRGVVRDAGAFIENERRCCAFFRFELKVSSDGVELHFLGPEEARAAVRAALELATEHRGDALLEAVTGKTGFAFRRE